MAGEIRFKTAKPLIKGQILDDAGRVWDGSAMQAESALSSTEWTGGLLALVQGATTDPDNTGLWMVDWPGGLTQAANYTVLFYSGASPVPGDQHVGYQLDPTEFVVAGVVTVLARLGEWAGSARNNILGAFQALFRKDADASVPSDVNINLGSGVGTASNLTESVQAIRDRGDAEWITGVGGGGGAGSGIVEVDHDTGGTDNLRYVTANGIGIDNAVIYAFLRADWDAGNRGIAAVRARSLTNVEGRWEWPMLLDPGWYVMYYFEQGDWGPDTITIQVI